MGLEQKQATTLYTGNTDYEEYTTTNLYVQRSFGFPANQLSLVNDSSTDTVQISFDGATLHYEVGPTEFKDIPANGKTSVYIKATTGGGNVRITAT